MDFTQFTLTYTNRHKVIKSEKSPFFGPPCIYHSTRRKVRLPVTVLLVPPGNYERIIRKCSSGCFCFINNTDLPSAPAVTCFNLNKIQDGGGPLRLRDPFRSIVPKSRGCRWTQ